MKVANVGGRPNLMLGGGVVDIHRASGGRFGTSTLDVLDAWDDVRQWSADVDPALAVRCSNDALGPPVPEPRQVFAIGLNYGDHAAESGLDRPGSPTVFTKFRASLVGPFAAIQLPTAFVDWEVELVAVVKNVADNISAGKGWNYIAGVMIGQDLSERPTQLAGPVPQFSIGKSFRGFGPTGPSLVDLEDIPDPDDIELGCRLDEEILQSGHSRDMLFPIPDIVSYLSSVCTLYPGDLIFTGTPSGVGSRRTPPRFLVPGTTLASWAVGVGEIQNRLERSPTSAGSSNPDEGRSAWHSTD